MSECKKNIFYIDNVHKYFIFNNRKVSIFEGVSVQFEQGKNYALTGISGSGKSTLINLLAGIDAVSSGNLSFNQQSLGGVTPASPDQHQQFLHTHIGLVFQAAYLIPELSVLENITIKELASANSTRNSQRAHHLLTICGLIDKIDTAVSLLSGGEQQRVAIARALYTQPSFLLADEPTAHLDTTTRDEILDLLLSVQEQTGMGLIIASHDPEVIKRMGTVYEISGKKLVERIK